MFFRLAFSEGYFKRPDNENEQKFSNVVVKAPARHSPQRPQGLRVLVGGPGDTFQEQPILRRHIAPARDGVEPAASNSRPNIKTRLRLVAWLGLLVRRKLTK
jgi:hypothetical protein